MPENDIWCTAKDNAYVLGCPAFFSSNAVAKACRSDKRAHPPLLIFEYASECASHSADEGAGGPVATRAPQATGLGPGRFHFVDYENARITVTSVAPARRWGQLFGSFCCLSSARFNGSLSGVGLERRSVDSREASPVGTSRPVHGLRSRGGCPVAT